MDWCGYEQAGIKNMLSPSHLGMFACTINFGMLAFNMGFTRADAIMAYNPQVFSHFGQATILVWGIAFLLAGLSDGNKPSYLWLAFTLEKVMYVSSWLVYIQHIPRPAISFANLEFLAPLFHVIYGPIDFVFMLLFAQQGVAAIRQQQDQVSRRKRTA